MGRQGSSSRRAEKPFRQTARPDRVGSSRSLVRQRSRSPGDLVVARRDGTPVNPTTSSNRAAAAWHRAGLESITLHEARHTFASLMIAAGVNARALSAYMGHASVTITYDRYGHLMPGNEDEAAALLDAYLKWATEVRPIAQP